MCPPEILSPQPDGAPADKIRSMFALISPVYDPLNRILSGCLDQRWRRRLVREATRGLHPRRVLDVATGTGDVVWELQCAPGVRTGLVVGVDFTRPMLEQARHKVRSASAWLEADATQLPLRDAAFDAVTVAFGLRNMTDPVAGLRQMYRVVRPGGRVAMLELTRPTHPPARWMYDFYARCLIPRIGRIVSGTDAYAYLVDSIHAFWPPERIQRQMQQAGLEAIQTKRMTPGVACLYIGTRPADDPRGR